MLISLKDLLSPLDPLVPSIHHFRGVPADPTLPKPADLEPRLLAHPALVEHHIFLESRNYEFAAYTSGLLYGNRRHARSHLPDGPNHPFASTVEFWRGLCDERGTLSMRLSGRTGTLQPAFRIDLESHVCQELVDFLFYEDDGAQDRSRPKGDPEPFTQEERDRLRIAVRSGRVQQIGDQAQKITWLLYREVVETADRPDGVLALPEHLEAAREILAWNSLRSRRGFIKLSTGEEIEMHRRGRPSPKMRSYSVLRKGDRIK